jgi:hypothetical protein
MKLKKKSIKKYIKKLESTGLTRQTRDMCYEIEITTKKQTIRNHEVQSPINQVLKDEIRKKIIDLFLKRKKKTLFGQNKTETFWL